jgi:alcohol dehydrogenase class IV
MTVPPATTADTGLDVLTHAIEAYVSVMASDYTDALAIKAIQLVFEYLPRAYRNGADQTAREKMHNASAMAGMAFTNAFLGINHSMAHKTGAAFADGHLIHGAANAMYLPKVIRYNAKDKTVAERYAIIADDLKLGGNTVTEKIDLLIAYVRNKCDELNMPHCIKNYGPGGLPAEQGFVTEAEFLKKLPEIAVNAIGDACTGSNPRQPSPEEMERLFKCCYYDLEVDF